MSGQVIKPCARCERERPHKARGLCYACYIAAWRRGELDCHPLRPDAPRYFRPNITPDDIDHAAVERIISGDWRLQCSPSDKAEVCRRWVRNGGSLRDLERLTGWATHRYYRIRDARKVA